MTNLRKPSINVNGELLYRTVPYRIVNIKVQCTVPYRTVPFFCNSLLITVPYSTGTVPYCMMVHSTIVPQYHSTIGSIGSLGFLGNDTPTGPTAL